MPPDHPARDMQDTFYLAGAQGVAPAHPHLVRRRSATCSTNPHPPRGAHHLPGQGLPARRRHHPLADVPADRGPGGGPGDHPRATSRARSRPSCTRSSAPGYPGALPPVVLPVHRAVGRGRPRLRRLRRQGLPRLQADRLARDHGLGHGAPRGVRGRERAPRPRRSTTPRRSPASPSASASSAWP